MVSFGNRLSPKGKILGTLNTSPMQWHKLHSHSANCKEVTAAVPVGSLKANGIATTEL